MLKILVAGQELYDDVSGEFIYHDDKVLTLEHSLVSISKWESKWCKPFLDGKSKTNEEIIDYVKCMTMTKNVDDSVFSTLTESNILAINKYIESSMTATTFRKESGGGNRETITSELIYYWMVSYNIPFECQKWHLNRLLTLIRVCNIKNTPPTKTSKQDLVNRNRELNNARRQQLNTNG